MSVQTNETSTNDGSNARNIDVSKDNVESEDTQTSAPPGYLDDDEVNDGGNDLDVIYTNLDSRSDWSIIRQCPRPGTIKGQLQRLVREIEAGCWDEVISVSASRNNFAVVVQTGLSLEELGRRRSPSDEKDETIPYRGVVDYQALHAERMKQQGKM